MDLQDIAAAMTRQSSSTTSANMYYYKPEDAKRPSPEELEWKAAKATRLSKLDKVLAELKEIQDKLEQETKQNNDQTTTDRD